MAAVRSTNSTKPTARIGLGWWLIGLALSAMVLLWWAGDKAQVALRYDRAAILHGEYWRLVTGHWVHGSLRHMALNALGALVIAFLFVRTYSITCWLWVLVLSMAVIDLGFVWLQPQLDWYVGASGVLHGALTAGAVVWWRVESRGMALALSAIVLGKLAWEQWQGALPLAGDMPVIVDAHLYGAIGGLSASACIEFLSWRARSKRAAAPL